MSNGWIGVDLDGTLAHYDHWRGAGHIGAPVTEMVNRVKAWLSEGKDVRIFTARVAHMPEYYKGTLVEVTASLDRRIQVVESITAIQRWCEEHIGKILPITCTKDFQMIELWDDRCRQVERNTGRLIGA